MTLSLTEQESRWQQTHEQMAYNLSHMVAVISATTGKPYVVKTIGQQNQFKVVDELTGEQLGGTYTYGVWNKIMGVALSVARDSRGYSIDELIRERKRLKLE